MTTPPEELTLDDLRLCFEGAVPAVIATADAAGTPNITYLSRVQVVDGERIALSNQFFSKTVRNLAENPRADVLLIDPITYEEYRLQVTYERTERRGPMFERLRRDVEALALLQGMQDVFKLRAADLYRVDRIERIGEPVEADGAPEPSGTLDPAQVAALGEMAARLARCGDLDSLVTVTVDSLAALFGYEQSILLLLDEEGRRLYTIASHGYPDEGIGSEVVVGEGLIGMTAARGTPLRLGNLRSMGKYSRTVRRSFEGHADLREEPLVPVPGLPEAQSRVAVPAMALGQLVGVLMVESTQPVAFTPADEAVLSLVAGIVAGAVEADRDQEPGEASAAVPPAGPRSAGPPGAARAGATVRFYPADGSTFLDGDYLIKGVAGRVLWSLLGQHQREGRTDFTNREVRLDPSLELPAFRDNFESRLILLKRRLEERGAPIRIEKTGRGRFRLLVDAPLQLEQAGD
jgi:adenylate cyclase